MDADFEKLKQRTEAELGRPLDRDEEHELKLLYYFGKGCKLKAQLEAEPTSGPERIGDILPGVMADIEARQQGHRRSVMQATADFLAGQRSAAKGRRLKVRAKHVRE